MSGAHETQDHRNWIASARSRLARRRAEKPSTKAAQIRALWPDIEAAIAVGQSMKTICAVPCHRIGDLWRFRASELDTWLRTGLNSKPPLVP